MLKFKYINNEKTYDVTFSKISNNVVQILGEVPFSNDGFTLSRAGKNDNWQYPEYTTLYRTIKGGLQFSNNGSVYVEPELIPEPYVPTLEELKEMKVTEMNMAQQSVIESGIDVTLTDGTVEHFTLTGKDQTSLMGLQMQVAMGTKKISWHTSDQTEHCKYYSNADMGLIAAAAIQYVTYHVTYFRDLRIYIRALTDKTEVEAVTYGMEIPEEYRSQPLSDMLAAE